MKAKQKITVTPDEFFDFIVKNVLGEIQKYAHRNTDNLKLSEGFKYNKRLKLKNKDYSVTVLIDKYQKPSLYQTITTVHDGKRYLSRYEIEEGLVQYSENVIDENGKVITSIPEKAFGALQSGSMKKKIRTINAIIEYRKNHPCAGEEQKSDNI